MDCGGAPRLSRGRWPGPIADGGWRGRTRINANRIAKDWGDFLGEYEWQQFVTLTIDAKRMKTVNDATVSREAFRWCNEAERLSRRPVGWAYAVEGGGGGWLHAHALLIGLRDESWQAIKDAWKARNGNIVTERVSDPVGAALYVCKSIGPNGEVVLSDTLKRYQRIVR